MKPGSFIVIVKTLQSRPTNWPSLKGLSLIAHFNFQRAAGVATQNLPSAVRLPFHRISVSRSSPEDKKPQCRSLPGDSATESLFQKRGEFCSAPLGLSTIYFRLPAAGFARLSAGVPKNRPRKYRSSQTAQVLSQTFFTSGSHLNFLQVVRVALRQARPRGADGMGRPGRPLRRSTRRYSSQRDEFHRLEMPRPVIK